MKSLAQLEADLLALGYSLEELDAHNPFWLVELDESQSVRSEAAAAGGADFSATGAAAATRGEE